MGDKGKCYICGCEECEYVIGGHPGKSRKLICPKAQRNPNLHGLLESKVRERDGLQEQIDVLCESL